MPLFPAASVLHPPFVRQKSEPPPSSAAVRPVVTARLLLRMPHRAGDGGRGGLPPKAAVSLQVCGGREGAGDAATAGTRRRQDGGRRRGIALLDKRQCCDGDTRKHRNGGK